MSSGDYPLRMNKGTTTECDGTGVSIRTTFNTNLRRKKKDLKNKQTVED
jgi:hypothetical protein